MVICEMTDERMKPLNIKMGMGDCWGEQKAAGTMAKKNILYIIAQFVPIETRHPSVHLL